MYTLNLELKQLDDNALDSKQWTRDLLKVFASGNEAANVGIIVGEDYCLTCDMTRDSSWHYYQLPTKVKDCAIEPNHQRLWFVTRFGTLAILDLHSNQWTSFEHNMYYERILYANENNVVVRSGYMYIIDDVRLQGNCLERVDTVIPVGFDSRNSAFDFTFLPERNCFLVLEQRGFEDGGNIMNELALSSVSWDGQAEKFLSIVVSRGSGGLLFPFFVAFDQDKQELIYADLRQDLIELKRQRLDLLSKHKPSHWFLFDSFVLNDDLFIIVKESDRWALMKLEQRFNVLYENSGKELWRHIAGRFLEIGTQGGILDVVRRQIVQDVSQSMLLRQLVQDEAERQKKQACITKPLKPLPAVKRATVIPNLDVVKFALHTLPFQIKEAAPGDLINSISSTTGTVAAFLQGGLNLLLADDLHCRYVAPGRWEKVTFDEHGRAWLCDDIGRHIAVVRPDTQEGLVFVMLGLKLDKDVLKLSVKNVAAYANDLILERDDKSLVIYHYDGELLREKWRLEKNRKIEGRIVGIKPDITNGPDVTSNGWWILTKDLEESSLAYLDNKDGSLQTKIWIRGELQLLGDWPEQTYFAYLDHTGHLLYTLNPSREWQHVDLGDALGLRSAQQEYSMKLISLHSVGDEIFTLIERNDALLFMRVQAESAQLISAFRRSWHQVGSMHLGDWIVLYSNSPFVFNPAYTAQSQITELPENERMLFFFHRTGEFYATPYTPYSIRKALYRSLMNGTKKSLKPLL
ncbi:MAG: hypothetical protein QXS54_01005 [Candidatus Methanomethylicaceae archaeon]